ncbi:MAG: hypothetical protein K2X34_12795 [Hyphomonadaceae bacterium]|nr:hypothetical protein [Hyphomonadaceae bacterium]
MISTHLKSGGAANIVGVFSFRYDAHLVPAMLASIEPMVDGWVCFDDRAGEGVFSNEVRRRRLLLEAARDIGARWALAIDPDERYEAALAAAIPALTAESGPCCYTFALREMYGENIYRVDGVWGQKRQARLLSLQHGLSEPFDQLHLPWSYFVPGHRLIDTDFNLYHLKMITRERRQARAALYNFLDPERRMQALGYDYLADDADAAFEAIAEGRAYHPPHNEDGGLWMPDVGAQ